MISRFLIMCALASVALAADDVQRMKPYQVSGRFVELYVTWEEDSGRIEEARVIWVAPGSREAQLGLRRGDVLVAINGAPIAGRPVKILSDFAKADLTFEGRRGLFRKKWSLTLNAHPLKDNEPNKTPEPTSGHFPGTAGVPPANSDCEPEARGPSFLTHL
jgi:membrane-associated protease RseP (regulator of RpoE activity)